MSEPEQNVLAQTLYKLFRLGQQDDAQGIASAQALLTNQHAARSMREHGKRMGAVQDAFWKCRYGEDYEKPEEEVGDNYVNCSIVSDQAVAALAGLANQGPGTGGTQPQPPAERPRKPWWWNLLKALMLLAGVLLGAWLVWFTLQHFGGETGPQYEIIAVPFDPNS